MILIDGKEIDFDMDNRQDHKRFTKAIDIYTKKCSAKKNDDDDIEAVLKSCLGEAVANELIGDGKLSTLYRISAEFNLAVANQIELLNKALKESDETQKLVIEKTQKFNLAVSEESEVDS